MKRIRFIEITENTPLLIDGRLWLAHSGDEIAVGTLAPDAEGAKLMEGAALPDRATGMIPDALAYRLILEGRAQATAIVDADDDLDGDLDQEHVDA